MKKSLIALAVAGAFAAPAFAATSNIDISGKMAADVQSVSGIADKDAGSDGKGMHVNNNNSAITISGNEDLGGGMKAFFSLTYGLPLTSGGLITGQNQIAGLEAGFGKVFVGAFDNPVKVIGRGVDLFADQSAGDARQMTAVGVSDARANDVIAYISPSMSGFQVVLAHANQNVGGAANSGRINIEKLAYTNGPLSVALAMDQVDNAAVGGTDAKDLRLTGSYKMGDARIVGLWQQNDNVGGVSATDSKTWGLGASYAMGPITLKGQYYAYDLKGSSTGDASMIALGADYAMSKRTTLQFAYSKVSNDTAAALGGAAAVAGSDALTVAAGEDPARLSIGMKHTF